jgi:hypothetical protein
VLILPILEAFVDLFVFTSLYLLISVSPRLAILSVEEAICILFVLRKKQFVSPSAAVVVVISIGSFRFDYEYDYDYEI